MKSMAISNFHNTGEIGAHVPRLMYYSKVNQSNIPMWGDRGFSQLSQQPIQNG